MQIVWFVEQSTHAPKWRLAYHDREGVMKDERQSMAIEGPIALHEQMVNVLKAKLFAKGLN